LLWYKEKEKVEAGAKLKLERLNGLDRTDALAEPPALIGVL
jgi:hypothetical protein